MNMTLEELAKEKDVIMDNIHRLNNLDTLKVKLQKHKQTFDDNVFQLKTAIKEQLENLTKDGVVHNIDVDQFIADAFVACVACGTICGKDQECICQPREYIRTEPDITLTEAILGPPEEYDKPPSTPAADLPFNERDFL